MHDASVRSCGSSGSKRRGGRIRMLRRRAVSIRVFWSTAESSTDAPPRMATGGAATQRTKDSPMRRTVLSHFSRRERLRRLRRRSLVASEIVEPTIFCDDLKPSRTVRGRSCATSWRVRCETTPVAAISRSAERPSLPTNSAVPPTTPCVSSAAPLPSSVSSPCLMPASTCCPTCLPASWMRLTRPSGLPNMSEWPRSLPSCRVVADA